MLRTPQESESTGCPILKQACVHAECMMWRWERMTISHPNWKAAVQTKGEEFGEKVPFPKASKYVADNPEEFGIIAKKGYCGMAGEPR